MKSLKTIVYSNLRRLAVAMMIAILFVAVIFLVLSMQNQARENANSTFLQIEQILRENTAELETIERIP